MPQNFVQWVIFFAIVAIAWIGLEAAGFLVPWWLRSMFVVALIACAVIAGYRFMKRQA